MGPEVIAFFDWFLPIVQAESQSLVEQVLVFISNNVDDAYWLYEQLCDRDIDIAISFLPILMAQ